MGSGCILLVVLSAVAGAQPVAVRVPAGEDPEGWARAAERVGLRLGAEPGCPGVVVDERGGDWVIRVCRDALWLEDRLPSGRGEGDRERALLAASRLLLLPVDSPAFQEAIAPAHPIEDAAARRELAASIAALAGSGLSSPPAGPAEGWIPELTPVRIEAPLTEVWPPAVHLEPLPTGGAWLAAGAGMRLRGETSAAAGLDLAGGWGWPGGGSLGLTAGLEQRSEPAFEALSAAGASFRDAALGAAIGWRGSAQLTAAAGLSTRQLHQGDRSAPAVLIPWLELGAALPRREGSLLVLPGLSLRWEARETAVRLDGELLGVLPPLSLALGLSFRLE